MSADTLAEPTTHGLPDGCVYTASVCLTPSHTGVGYPLPVASPLPDRSVTTNCSWASVPTGHLTSKVSVTAAPRAEILSGLPMWIDALSAGELFVTAARAGTAPAISAPPANAAPMLVAIFLFMTGSPP